MNCLFALAGLAGVTTFAFLLEAWLYRRRLNSIPIRVHVNGTRGKSSVARLIAAGLRGGGICTCAKTTGTLARMIFPSGEELPIFRPARANVIEQKRVVRAAANAGAEALVIECMALQPLLQSTCELQLVRSTHGVITNARADHLDVMGPSRLDVATALVGTTPVGGKLFTAESRIDSLKVMQAAAQDRGSDLQIITANDSAEITEEELAQFSYLEHAENVALALRVCESIGVQRGAALAGMWAATPDPGAMKVHTTEVATMPLFDSSQPTDPSVWHFVNGFAANDPESTEALWETAFNRFPDSNRRVMVMNCREDRPDRSEIMGAAAGGWSQADQIIVIGTGTELFVRAARKSGVDPSRIVCLGDVDSMPEIAEAIACDDALCEPGVMVMGVGNVKNGGFALDSFFEEHKTWVPQRVAVAQKQIAASSQREDQLMFAGAEVAGAS